MSAPIDLSKFAGNASSVKIDPTLGFAAFDADSHYSKPRMPSPAICPGVEAP